MDKTCCKDCKWFEDFHTICGWNTSPCFGPIIENCEKCKGKKCFKEKDE